MPQNRGRRLLRRAPRDVKRVEHERRVGARVDRRRRRSALQRSNHHGQPVHSQRQRHQRGGASTDIPGLAERGDQPAQRRVLRVVRRYGQHSRVGTRPVTEVKRVLQQVGPEPSRSRGSPVLVLGVRAFNLP